jgi:hypothetical protein
MHPTGRSHSRGWLDLAIVLSVTVGTTALIEATRSFPFSSTDDGPFYFVPLIKAHTEAWMRGAPGAYLWSLGSGHSVWESGQLGAMYLPYVFANLLARLCGEPLLLLEVSAVLHLLLAGLLAWWLLPDSYRGIDRGLAAALVAVQPAPIILGANWTPYLSSYPWFVALLLLCEPSNGDGSWPRSRRLGVLAASLGFLATAHPQMLAVGLFLVATRCLTGGFDLETRLRNLRSFLVAQIPSILPMIFIFATALKATPGWMAGRDQNDFLLREAQSLGTVLQGIFLGNLVESQGLALWQGVSWTGVGIFFAPWLILSFYPSLRSRRFGWPVLALLMVGLTALQSFPLLRLLAVGPLAGFRWTWKLAWFLGPTSLILVLVQMRPTERFVPAWRALASIAIVLCVLVGARGIHFDLFPPLRFARPGGIVTVVEETRRLAETVGMEAGDRIALLGSPPIGPDALPLALLGLIGNAPLLADLGSAHLYEPMEPLEVSRTHFGLSTPWRMPVLPDRYLEDPARIERALASIGTRWLVTAYPGLLYGEEVRTFVGRDGLSVFVAEIPPPIASWPMGIGDQGPVPVALLDNGEVVTAAPTREPPDMGIGREMRWRSEEDRRLRGRVRQLSPAWIGGEILALTLAILTLFGSARSPAA